MENKELKLNKLGTEDEEEVKVKAKEKEEEPQKIGSEICFGELSVNSTADLKTVEETFCRILSLVELKKGNTYIG